METLRESSIGHLVRFFSRDTLLKYPDERTKFELALQRTETDPPTEPKVINEVAGGTADVESASSTHSKGNRSAPPLRASSPGGAIIVGWYSHDDAENPQNWTKLKRYSVGLLLWCVTMVF
jgi:DHA1 family multidrug resistance protein-like MFS transporter